MAGKVIGIDLGTTRTVVAHVDEAGRVEIVPNAESDRLTPSVVLFEESGEVVVGRLALESAIAESERVVQFVKRDMGRPGATYDFGGQSYTPEEVSALILRKVVGDAERRLGQPIVGAVLTVPAYFNDVQRKATADAGRIAGLEVLGVLNEPVAAALADGRTSARGDGTTLVFDLGGGTFDTTVMSTAGGEVRMLATDGDDHLGGKDFDDRLILHAAGAFEAAHGLDPLEDRTTYQDLAERCEAAKIALGRKERVKIAVGAGGLVETVEVDRGRYEALCEDLLGRLEVKTSLVLEAAGLGWGDVDRILLVGGATRMPMVRSMLERAAPGVEIVEAACPDEIVALGAALQAEQAAGGAVAGGEIALGCVNSHSLGVVARVDGRFANCVIIPRNTPIPARERGRFQTIHDQQTRVEIIVLEGEEDDPERCTTIGTCVITDLPARPKGAPITIEYGYDAAGRVEVRALDVETGRQATTTIERPGGMTQAGLAEATRRLAGVAVT